MLVFELIFTQIMLHPTELIQSKLNKLRASLVYGGEPSEFVSMKIISELGLKDIVNTF